MITAIYIFSVLTFIVAFTALVIVWRTHDALVRFSQMLRHNNPDNEIDIIMGNGYRYKIIMDKESK